MKKSGNSLSLGPSDLSPEFRKLFILEIRIFHFKEEVQKVIGEVGWVTFHADESNYVHIKKGA